MDGTGGGTKALQDKMTGQEETGDDQRRISQPTSPTVMVSSDMPEW